MTIHLVRHGETQGNAERVVQRPEVPLSAVGRDQARRLGERLARAGIGHILTSDLARAEMTAEALRDATGAPLERLADLQERNLGDWRGTPYAALEVDIFAPEHAPPGGESWAAFHARVDRAWERVRAAAEATDGHLLVVTHGLVCFSLASRRFALEAGHAIGLSGFANASLTLVEAAPPHAVTLLNCTAHLRSLSSAGRRSGGRAGLRGGPA